METNKISNSKIVTITISSFLLLSLVGNLLFFGKQGSIKNERDKAILKMDSLLSVKLLVDKELDQAKNQIESYKGKNSELDKTIADMDAKLNASKIEVEKLVKDNASVHTLRKKLKETQKLRDESDKIVANYVKDNDKLQSQNNSLNQSINKYTQELAALKEKLELAKVIKAYNMVVVNYKVTKKSNKPTVKARKVNRISATFDLAENPIAEPGLKEIYMVVYDAKGNVIGPQNKKFINKSGKNEQVYSTSKPLDYKNKEVITTVNFDTEQKLTKGKYKLEIYIDGTYSGKKEFILK